MFLVSALLVEVRVVMTPPCVEITSLVRRILSRMIVFAIVNEMVILCFLVEIEYHLTFETSVVVMM